ncbi:hypothetical protein CSV75_12630 [Sporosarcina sp. P18a]|uniref:hypothetical protein n=1 Tax=Sporosarcina sp. P18a TaxID=2048259 RepID=UPI000C16989F|nr:hypothetical protein [Sporosarcina sp. P18a]PIC79431.1 hypothetical protein CSV75_12630 [Sporosarcina sp. P18a]
MKNAFLILGMSMTIIVGGGFLIHLIRDSDFYIAEFIVGIIGIIMLISVIFLKGGSKSPDNKYVQ